MFLFCFVLVTDFFYVVVVVAVLVLAIILFVVIFNFILTFCFILLLVDIACILYCLYVLQDKAELGTDDYDRAHKFSMPLEVLVANTNFLPK